MYSIQQCDIINMLLSLNPPVCEDAYFYVLPSYCVVLKEN